LLIEVIPHVLDKEAHWSRGRAGTYMPALSGGLGEEEGIEKECKHSALYERCISLYQVDWNGIASGFSRNTKPSKPSRFLILTTYNLTAIKQRFREWAPTFSLKVGVLPRSLGRQTSSVPVQWTQPFPSFLAPAALASVASRLQCCPLPPPTPFKP
jgi:hypothetical protein